MKTTLMIVLCGVSILASGCSKPHKSDSITLQGSWSGPQVGVSSHGLPSLIVEGTKLEFRYANTNDWYKATFLLKEDVTPKQVEAVITDCPYSSMVGKTAHGIYKIEDGKLTFTINDPDNPKAPTSFDAKGASEFIFTRKQ